MVLYKEQISFEVDLKFLALSENITFGVPRRAMNDLKAFKNSTVPWSLMSSRWTALLWKQVKSAP
jgi:hypothetical protein